MHPPVLQTPALKSLPSRRKLLKGRKVPIVAPELRNVSHGQRVRVEVDGRPDVRGQSVRVREKQADGAAGLEETRAEGGGGGWAEGQGDVRCGELGAARVALRVGDG